MNTVDFSQERKNGNGKQAVSRQKGTVRRFYVSETGGLSVPEYHIRTLQGPAGELFLPMFLYRVADRGGPRDRGCGGEGGDGGNDRNSEETFLRCGSFLDWKISGAREAEKGAAHVAEGETAFVRIEYREADFLSLKECAEDRMFSLEEALDWIEGLARVLEKAEDFRINWQKLRLNPGDVFCPAAGKGGLRIRYMPDRRKSPWERLAPVLDFCAGAVPGAYEKEILKKLSEEVFLSRMSLASFRIAVAAARREVQVCGWVGRSRRNQSASEGARPGAGGEFFPREGI